ncbi:MAG: hypothetical protein ABFE07_28460 [Armatimonadia bacterium]
MAKKKVKMCTWWFLVQASDSSRRLVRAEVPFTMAWKPCKGGHESIYFPGEEIPHPDQADRARAYFREKHIPGFRIKIIDAFPDECWQGLEQAKG